MDLLDGLDVAVNEFRSRLAGVGRGDWQRATPCGEWDVRFLVAHVVGGHLFAAPVLSGMSADAAIGEVMAASLLGDDALGRHDELAEAQRDGFRRPGALEGAVDHPAGSTTGAAFLAMRVFDVAVHAWDLAVATGQSVDDFDQEVGEAALSWMRATLPPQIRGSEADGRRFGPEVAVAPNAPLYERLAAFAGHDPAFAG